jgi:thiol:disulfide interchange protein DsbD
MLAWLLVMPASLSAFPFGNQPAFQAEAYLDRTAYLAGSQAEIVVVVNVAPKYKVQSARPYDPKTIPTKLTVKPMPGVLVNAIKYPQHHDVPELPGGKGGGKMAVYAGEFYLLVDLSLEPSLALGQHTLALELEAQACDAKSCLPPEVIQLSVPIMVGNQAGAPAYASQFAQAKAQKWLETGTTATAPVTTMTIAQITTVDPTEELALLQNRHYRTPAPEGVGTLLLFALLGGMILNVMPCVLPVIPLKVLAFVQHAGGQRRVAFYHALVFSVGIVTLFVGLGAILALLRGLGGVDIAYGNQFQSPLFLIVMAVIVVTLGLSMLGVWTLDAPNIVYDVRTPRSGYGASFASGLLATLLATPCSAPFLGPVVGWAFTQSAGVMILMLLVVGVGMALPYLILAAFPAALRFLPKTGAWTDLFKQFLGLVMIGVGVWLITRSPNPVYWKWGGWILLLGAAGCWAWALWSRYATSTLRLYAGRGVLVVGILAGGFGLWSAGEREAQAAQATSTHLWQPFSVKAMDQALASGRTVVVDWTADWCINCKFVEATVLESPEVKMAFKQHNVLLLKADITRKNPPAEALRNLLGYRSIPLLAVFKPDQPDAPRILADYYSRQQVIDALE